jgi:hypothetical protein
MAYPITLTNGTEFVVVQDSTTNTTATDLTLVGKNFRGYGEQINENFVHLLENFSHITAPINPLDGQLWFDSGSKVLYVMGDKGGAIGEQWIALGSITKSITAPPDSIVSSSGDLWWDEANEELKVREDSVWRTILTEQPTGTGISTTSGPDTTSLVVSGVAKLTATATTLTSYATSNVFNNAVTAPTINKVTITAPASTATLTLANSSSLITVGANSVTLTSTGTTSATLPVGTTTLASVSDVLALAIALG